MSTIPYTPRSFDKLPVTNPPFPIKVMDRWTQLLGSIAAGMTIPEAMVKHYMTRADIEACCRLDAIEVQRWNDAKTASMKRAWSQFEFDEIFERISDGMPVSKAVAAVKGPSPEWRSRFYILCNRDPVLKSAFREAKEASTVAMAEELVDIADDDSGDTLSGPKGDIPNMAAVNRSKLRVDTRARLMANYNMRLYGDNKGKAEVTININHAERLEEARDRAKNKRISKPEQRDAIDAEFTSAPALPAVTVEADTDTSWMDEKPTDAQWREES